MSNKNEPVFQICWPSQNVRPNIQYLLNFFNVSKCKKLLTWRREVSKKCYRRYYGKRQETINKSLIDETTSKRTNVQHFNDLDEE